MRCVLHIYLCCVTSTLTLTLTVVSPKITTHPTDTSAAAPFSGVFTCSASGYGHLNITWYRTPGLLPDKSRTSEVYSPEVTTSTLVIPNVTNDDVGSYYCVVKAKNLGTWSRVAKLINAGMQWYSLTYCITGSKLLCFE